MNKYKLYQIDSFTKEKFKGNPAGVVTNADGLTDDKMQQIAREMNLSETAFIFSPDSDNHDMIVRYFTPKCEVPICGHATIAAHYALACEKDLSSSLHLQKCGAGILPIEINKENNDYKVIMTQGKIEFSDVLSNDLKAEILSALNLKNKDIIDSHPIQIASTGHSKVMIALKSEKMLHSLEPNYMKLTKISKAIGCNGYYTFAYNTKDNDILISGRMFAPAVGINEDPVTGNANGPLGAYLVHHELLKHDGLTASFKIKQGEKMGRPGVMDIIVSVKENKPVSVKIAGNAIMVFKTEIVL